MYCSKSSRMKVLLFDSVDLKDFLKKETQKPKYCMMPQPACGINIFIKKMFPGNQN